MSVWLCFFFFKQKTAYEMRISDWSSDVCSSDLAGRRVSDARLFGWRGGAKGADREPARPRRARYQDAQDGRARVAPPTARETDDSRDLPHFEGRRTR